MEATRNEVIRLRAENDQLRADNAVLRQMVKEYREGVRQETIENIKGYEKRKTRREMWAQVKGFPDEVWKRLPVEAQAVLTAMGIVFTAGCIVDLVVRVTAWWVMRF